MAASHPYAVASPRGGTAVGSGGGVSVSAVTSPLVGVVVVVVVGTALRLRKRRPSLNEDVDGAGWCEVPVFTTERVARPEAEEFAALEVDGAARPEAEEKVLMKPVSAPTRTAPTAR